MFGEWKASVRRRDLWGTRTFGDLGTIAFALSYDREWRQVLGAPSAVVLQRHQHFRWHIICSRNQSPAGLRADERLSAPVWCLLCAACRWASRPAPADSPLGTARVPRNPSSSAVRLCLGRGGAPDLRFLGVSHALRTDVRSRYC